MIEVIFDSSFLMALAETPTTWYEDLVEGLGKFEPIFLQCVKEELSRLASGSGKTARTATVALDLASSFSIRPCGRAAVDDEILSAAASMGAVVATVDAELLHSAKAARRKVVTLRRGRVAVA